MQNGDSFTSCGSASSMSRAPMYIVPPLTRTEPAGQAVGGRADADGGAAACDGASAGFGGLGRGERPTRSGANRKTPAVPPAPASTTTPAMTHATQARLVGAVPDAA